MIDIERTKELILERKEEGKIVFFDSIGRLVSCPIEEICDQPIEGLLYDLNRGEETILALAKADNIQWVNNFAATQVIRYLYNKIEELKEKDNNENK